MKHLRVFLTITAAAAMGFSLLGGIDLRKVEASTAPQTLPFSQNWANAGLITVNNDWSGVPGIVGYRGDDLTTATGTDPSTILADGSGTPVNVIANQSNPNTQTTGGIAEFEITDPVVALQGSGTADAPHIVIYLNTTGQSNIRFQCNLRDVDGAADDAVQPIAIQYRVGGTGNYANVPGGFFPDVTTGGTATQVTPVDLTLPSGADNQSIVEIRVMTTNAVGSDEWVGIDDISVTGGEAPPAEKAYADFNGDGKTDFSVVRNTGGGENGQVRWFNQLNGGTVEGADFGIASDAFLAADYDGDGNDDISVWRPSEGVFYIFESSTSTVRIEQFGQEGDNPSVVGDYDGDGKADLAVYRPGAESGDPSTWFYRIEANGPTYYVPWGQNGDVPYVGDFDMDGKRDLVIKRDNGGLADFWVKFSNEDSYSGASFGFMTDENVIADMDGDGFDDITAIRDESGQLVWYTALSSVGGVRVFQFGSTGDHPVVGDYDGDGKDDVAIWRDGAPGQFWMWNSSNLSITVTLWGQNGDHPVANARSY